MNQNRARSLAVALLLPLAAAVPRAEAQTIGSPAPGGDSETRGRARELRTDRPDTTESPFTVPSGMWQVEFSVAEYAGTAGGEAGAHQTTLFPLLIKRGLGSTLDLEIFIQPHLRESGGDAAAAPHTGTGDLILRAKLNLLGNDGGRVALGALPFLTLPTGATGVSGDAFDGGLIVPVAIRDIPGGFEIGTMAGLQSAFSAERSRREFEGIHSVSASRPIFGTRTGAFLEYAGTAASRGRYRATVDVGVTYAWRPNVQFDAAVDFGVSGAADRVRLLAGLSVRR